MGQQIESASHAPEGTVRVVMDGQTYFTPLAAIEARDGAFPRLVSDWIGKGNAIAEYVPTLTPDDYAAAIQAHVDDIAKARGYADGVALAGYSTSTIPTWAAEAEAFIQWRDTVWIYAYTELAKVQGGQRSVPTIDGLIAELPVIKWPGG